MIDNIIELKGRKASNVIGALGEIIAWRSLGDMGIESYKLGIWGASPTYYNSTRSKTIERLNRFLTKEQVEFIENKVPLGITEFDFVGFKRRQKIQEEIEDAYLIEVKTGRNVRHYLKNPRKTIAPNNLKIARILGFKILVIIIEILENWRCKVSIKEIRSI